MKTDYIRTYRSAVVLEFAERGDSFTLNVPHYPKWKSIISFLKRRGFKVTENVYFKKQFGVLSKYHKIGFKKDVALLMEIGSGSITIEFGNIKNLWQPNSQSFWSNKSDDRYKHLTYLEELAVQLELKKLIQFCQKNFNMPLESDENKFSPEEKIIHNLKRNTHIHGIVNSLEDIKLSMEKKESYNNNIDKNKKKITCGEEKYFYDYRTKRLSKGIVWHHINNMWWVIVSGDLRNIASFELFDFDPSLPKRKPIDKYTLDRTIEKFIQQKKFQKCADIQHYAVKNKLIDELV